MRAIVCRELAGLDGLALEPDWPLPEPGPGEVRIRVRAAGLNFADTLMIKGQYQDRPALPFVPGIEVAGRIERCGEGVAGFTPGERVMATPDHGGFAEAVVTSAVNVVRRPDTIRGRGRCTLKRSRRSRLAPGPLRRYGHGRKSC